MNILLLIISIFLLTVAHFWKVKRQKQFIEIYEKPNEKYLLRGLSIGYIINLILPIKLGTLFRVIYPGKKMKNGVSFSFATIIIDIILDFLFLAFIYIILYFCNFTIRNNMIYYLIICIIILISIIIAFYFNKTIKNMILKIAMIFNDSIELRILKTFWFTITSFKDVIEKVSKIKLLFYTIIMWTLYLSSYACLGLYFEHLGYSFNFIDIFNMFYSVVGLSVPTLYFFKNASITNITVIIIYVIVPILLIYLYSIIYKNKKINNKKYVELLPHINIQDRLAFLVAYFNADNRDYFKNYIALNNDVAIIEDFSAGSNVTTMLCCKENKTFFRKYSFGNDAKKLFDQIRWIQDHQNNIKLTTIENIKNSDNYCSYDMPYNPNAVTCFNYVHTVPVKESWPIIENALKDIDENLHTINIRKADPEYI